LIIKQDEDEAEAAEVFVDGTIGANEYRFLLDTGAARSGVMFDDYTSQLKSIERSRSSGLFATSSEDIVTVPSIRVGPISRRDFTLVRAANHFPGANNLIGMDLLKDWCCHFFFDENRVSVTTDEELRADLAFQELLLDSRFHPVHRCPMRHDGGQSRLGYRREFDNRGHGSHREPAIVLSTGR